MSSRVLIESFAHLVNQRSGSRYEFLVCLMHPNGTLFCIISFLALLKPLGMGLLLFTTFCQGRPSRWLHKCGCAQCLSATSGDYIRMEPYIVDFLLLVALSLGLSRVDGFRCSDLNCWVGFQVMLSLGASLLLWPRALLPDPRMIWSSSRLDCSDIVLSQEWESLIITDSKWCSMWCSWSSQLFLTDYNWFLVHESDIGSPSPRNRSFS